MHLLSNIFFNRFTCVNSRNTSLLVLYDSFTCYFFLYFRRFVLRLHESDGFSDMGNISLKLAICLLLAWVVIFFCLMKGIKSSGKVDISV